MIIDKLKLLDRETYLVNKNLIKGDFMNKKEIVTKENLIEVLDLLDSMEMRYWIDGGWGIKRI